MQCSFELILSVLTLVSWVEGYPYFQQRIPNGRNIPNPCLSTCTRNCDAKWMGVGHKDIRGGGARNPFGRDFASNNYIWNRRLCSMDSDGDGRTNGQELGDPYCTWSIGEIPRTNHLSHPGVCEPVNSALCQSKNVWNVCQETVEEEFKCDGIKDSRVRQTTLQMTKGTIPSRTTTYYCQLFDLPRDRQYDILANQPVVDNKKMLHHMLLYGCSGDTRSVQVFRSPQPCSEMMFQETCGQILAGWTPGQAGDCFDGLPAATRIGRDRFTHAMLEVHWHNPLQHAGQRDGSGITLHYTPELRQYTMGVLTVGQMNLKIPPQSPGWNQSSRCTSDCTWRKLRHKINIVSAGLHMHGTGTGGSLSLYRYDSGLWTKVSEIISEPNYSIDQPTDYNQSPALGMWPGDELRMTCVFDTSNHHDYVYYGEGTTDEMCYSFITYYPETNFNECVQFGGVDFCQDQTDFKLVETCVMAEINDAIYRVQAECQERYCTRACRQVLMRAYRNLIQRTERFSGCGKLCLEWLLPQCEIPGLYSDSFVRKSRSCDKEINV